MKLNLKQTAEFKQISGFRMWKIGSERSAI